MASTVVAPAAIQGKSSWSFRERAIDLAAAIFAFLFSRLVRDTPEYRSKWR